MSDRPLVHSAIQPRITLAILFAINFMNFFHRTAISMVLEPIRKEFALNDTTLGLIVTCTTITYAIASIPVGRLTDLRSRGRLLAISCFGWSAATVGSAMAGGFLPFLASRLVFGGFQASCQPAANSLIGSLFPPALRARAVGIFMLGLPLGVFASLASIGALSGRVGWRNALLIASAPGFLVALVAWLFIREPARTHLRHATAEHPTSTWGSFRKVLSIPTMWWIILSGITFNFSGFTINTFLPTLLVRFNGISQARAGVLAAIVLGLTGVVGLTGGGWIADWLHTHSQRARLMFGSISTFVAAPLLYLGFTRQAGELEATIILLAAGWLCCFPYYVTAYASIQEVVTSRLRGTAMAGYFFFQLILGAAFSTTVVGAVSDLLAHNAMRLAGAQAMNAAFRAQGLHGAMQIIVPAGALLTGVMLAIASGSFGRDAATAARHDLLLGDD